MIYAQKIYQFVSSIPAGKVVTYGQVAKLLKIGSARLVGQALHRNTDPENIPCHRVVFSNGALAKKYAFGGEKNQRKKLIKEGISFIKNKVDLKKHLLRI